MKTPVCDPFNDYTVLSPLFGGPGKCAPEVLADPKFWFVIGAIVLIGVLKVVLLRLVKGKW